MRPLRPAEAARGAGCAVAPQCHPSRGSRSPWETKRSARPCACMTRMEGEKWRARSGRTAWGTGSGVRHTRGRVHWVCGRAAGAGRRGGATTRIWIEIKRRRGGGVMSPARGAGGGRCGGGRGCVHGWGLCAHSVLVPSGSCQNNLILHALMPCELWLRRKVRREDCG